jgi:hypothetical protein
MNILVLEVCTLFCLPVNFNSIILHLHLDCFYCCLIICSLAISSLLQAVFPNFVNLALWYGEDCIPLKEKHVAGILTLPGKGRSTRFW